MAIQDVWFSNLKALIQNEGGGRRGIRAVADASGLSEEYVYQLAEKKLNSKGVPREIGKDAANKIAISFANGRNIDWFDELQKPDAISPDNKPNQGPAQSAPAQGAININSNQVMQAKDVVEALAGLLAEADPGRLESVTGMLRDLARTPTDDELIKALTGLLGKKTFVEKHQRQA